MRAFLFLVPIAFLLPTHALAEVKQTCSEETVCVEVDDAGGEFTFHAINKKSALPITVSTKVSSSNIDVVEGAIESVVLDGGERKFLFKLAIVDMNEGWRYNYKFDWAYGSFDVEHDADFEYSLPYQKGNRHMVSQGCNGEFSHKYYAPNAIDFEMREGTPIHAARDGRVVDVVNDFKRGGSFSGLRGKDNNIKILHSDGTIGSYNHLMPDGVSVELNSEVKAGEMIGFSGNTGFSSGPHLHFTVTRARKDGRELETFPIILKTQIGPVTCPTKGSWLEAQ